MKKILINRWKPKCGVAFGVLFMTIWGFISLGHANAPDEVSGPDVISVQVSGGTEGVGSPFIVPGESLISLVSNLVDFESEGTNIVFHRSTGKLFVKNTPQNIKQVEGILAELRKYVAEEVLIEARIIEVTAFEGSDVGVELQNFSWNTFTPVPLGGTGRGSLDFTGNTGGTDLTDWGAGSWGDNQTLAPENEFSILSAFSTNNFSIDVLITALGQKVKLNTLSAPRISCFNNQRANIRVTRTQAYISDYDVTIPDTTATGSGTTEIAAILEPVVSEAQSGIVLDITPTVSTDKKTIVLEFHPTVIDLELDPQTVTLSADAADVTISFPNFTTRSLDTTVTIPDGGTVVIGGLMSREEQDDVRKVPGLGDIPLIGNLFKTRTKYDDKTNLLFFITAKVKDSQKTF